MRHRTTWILALAVLVGGYLGRQAAARYSWQQSHAKVLETGDIEWAPRPFRFQVGDDVRYIDFDSGDDSNSGTTPDSPWKHHPWDENAAGRAARGGDADTYVFKRGVTYRGVLAGEVSGTAASPVRLTSSPDWGEGDAVIAGSEHIPEGWQRADATSAPAGMPEPEGVWYVDLSGKYTPRKVWLVEDDKITTLDLARTPNWEVSNPDDVKSEWWQWEDGSRGDGPGGSGIDTENLTASPEYYEGALVYTEWGLVMGTPAPVPVTGFDAEKHELSFEGFFNPAYGMSIEEGMRYYLENKPHYLDSPGEWWFDSERSRLYVRLPGDADPDAAHLEIARHKNLIDLRDVEHLHISGLVFRFTNVGELGQPGFKIWADEHEVACVRLRGNIVDVAVTNNVFEHVNAAVRCLVDMDGAVGEDIRITDNDVRHADHLAFHVANSYWLHESLQPAEPTEINGLSILRNSIYMAGLRPHRGSHGHTVVLYYPQTAEVAGNVLDRIYGAGLFIFGGKPSGEDTDVPFSRIIVHHNKTTDTLLNTNDWGGIETWQGGPFYVYNNISGNPGGYRHWRWLRQKDAPDHRIGHVGTRFGHAYYMDGSFKNYHFNNIAWGKENDLRSPLMNTAAFQEIHGYQNNAYNNTVFKFGAGSRRQTPQPGRNLYLGNIWADISDYVFAHGPIPGVREINIADVGEVGEDFDYTTVGYANNVFWKIRNHLSTLEPDQESEKTAVEAMAASLKALGAYAWTVGEIAEQAPFRDAQRHDFRPADGSPAIGFGVRPFVPWSLYGTVGEWHFYRNRTNPEEVVDNHWYMTPLHIDRTTYKHLPTWPLVGHNIDVEDYVEGALEDWIRGALRLNGRDQYLRADLPDPDRVKDVLARAAEPVTQQDFDGWLTITHPSAIIPGREFTITVVPNETVPDDKVLQAFLGARRPRAWAGTHGTAEEREGFRAGGTPLEFTITPQMASGLTEYVVVVHYGDEPGWDNHEKAARVPVPYMPAHEVAPPEAFRTPDVHRSSMIVEAYVRVEEGAEGVLVQKMDADRGYALTVRQDGRLEFMVKAPDASAKVTSATDVATGQWHHVLAECDRDRERLTLYVDGRSDGVAEGIGPQTSLRNGADFFVGGTPEGGNLAVALDFLRVTRGSLADSRTTIDELYQWQFDGPFLRDFTGRKPFSRRDAGAIQSADQR